MENIKNIIEKYKTSFEKNISNDLSINNALSIIIKFTNEIKKIGFINISKEDKKLILEFMEKVESVFGIGIFENENIPKEIFELGKQRQKFREEKNFEKSDEIRKEVEKKGYKIIDTKKTFEIKKI